MTIRDRQAWALREMTRLQKEAAEAFEFAPFSEERESMTRLFLLHFLHSADAVVGIEADVPVGGRNVEA